MTTNELHDELAYIRRLAEQGSVGPMRNGASLVWAGFIYAAAALAQYAVTLGYLPRTVWASVVIWLGASIVFAVAAYYCRFNRREGVEQSAGSRANAAAWSGVGIGIMFFILCLIVIANVMKDFAAVSFLIAPVVLLMYGVGWWVGAGVSGVKWVRLIAFGCFAAAPAITLMAGHAEQLLAYAACLVLFAALPGLALMRAEKG